MTITVKINTKNFVDIDYGEVFKFTNNRNNLICMKVKHWNQSDKSGTAVVLASGDMISGITMDEECVLLDGELIIKMDK